MYFCGTVSHFFSLIAVVILFCFVSSVKSDLGWSWVCGVVVGVIEACVGVGRV